MRILIFIAAFFIAGTCLAQGSGEKIGQIVKESLSHNYASKGAGSFIAFKNEAGVWAPKDYSNKRTGTLDSERGEIEGPALKINYDMGFSAGTHMGIHKKKDCIAYYDTSANGHKVYIGLVKSEQGNELIITLADNDIKDPHAYPANFWTIVKDENDFRELLKIVLTYKSKKDKTPIRR
jgi:hypothetical protein